MTSARTPNLVLRAWRITQGLTRQQMADAVTSLVPIPATVLIASCDAAAAPRLGGITQTARGLGVAAIVLGPWPGGVTCQADADGTLDAVTPPDPRLQDARLYGLDADEAAAIIAVLREAHGVPPAAPDAAREPAVPSQDEPARLAAFQTAASLYRGELAEGAGYDWAETSAEDIRVQALNAWTGIAGILQFRDPAQALAALETALGHDPYNESLYQRIMRLQADAGHPEAARRTFALLEARLAGLGVSAGVQTRQVAALLLGPDGPASPSTRAGSGRLRAIQGD